MSYNVELLSPAGSIDALKAAIAGGANAVYLGLDSFNARIKAENFSLDNIAFYTRYCHLFNVSLYVAFNILIKDNELEKATTYIKALADAEVDAIIISDIGLIPIIQEYALRVPIHASTQMGIHNYEGAAYVESLGIKRVILSRETTLNDIKKIKENTNLEIECFIQGALCVSFSGNCYFSSITTGKSGNRGRCLQPCRLMYSFMGDKAYHLSIKDLSLRDKVKSYVVNGVDSLKIEGRAIKKEYVYFSTMYYRNLIDNNFKSDDILLDNMKSTFNRGDYTYGYSEKDKKIERNINGHIGVYWGKILKKIDRSTYLVQADKDIAEGTGLKSLRGNIATSGGRLLSIKKDKKHYIINIEGEYNAGDTLNITSLVIDIKEPCINLKLTVSGSINDNLMVKAELVNANDNKETCNSIIVKTDFILEQAMSDKGIDIISKTFNMFYDSIFKVSELIIKINDNIFIPPKELKALKRKLIDNLEANLLKNYYDNKINNIENSSINGLPRDNNIASSISSNIDASMSSLSNISCNTDISVSSVCNKFNDYIVNDNIISNKNNLKSVNQKNNKLIAMEICEVLDNDILSKANYIIYNALDKSLHQVNADIKALSDKKRLYIKLNNIARDADIEYIHKMISTNIMHIRGVLADNLYAITIAKSYYIDVFLGSGLNIANLNTISLLDYNNALASIELNERELKNLSKCSANLYVYSYGYTSLMSLSVCPFKEYNNNECNNCSYNKNIPIYDRKYSFMLNRIKMHHCYFKLMNSLPHCLNLDKYNNLNYYYDFTNVKKEDIIDILDKKMEILSTKGHLNRGVE